jgi:hypothetical protein
MSQMLEKHIQPPEWLEHIGFGELMHCSVKHPRSSPSVMLDP